MAAATSTRRMVVGRGHGAGTRLSITTNDSGHYFAFGGKTTVTYYTLVQVSM